jgi:nickel-dependent lactate racemase
MGWGTSHPGGSFRRDLDEIARRIGLNTTVALVVNADREVVGAFCGDTWLAHSAAERLVREEFCAPRPTDHVDVVVANAYPNDLSLTFVRMKGMQPLAAASPRTSKVVIAACSEGIGFHGLFPMANASPEHRRRLKALKARILLRRPRRLVPKVVRRLSRRGAPPTALDGKPTWLYRPAGSDAPPLSRHVPPDINVTSSWDDVVAAIQREQGEPRLRVAVYPCAPLQWLG